jgi:hypothetical protein
MGRRVPAARVTARCGRAYTESGREEMEQVVEALFSLDRELNRVSLGMIRIGGMP